MNYPIPELWELVVLGCVCNRTNRQENQGTWPLGHFHHLHDHHVCCNRGNRQKSRGRWLAPIKASSRGNLSFSLSPSALQLSPSCALDTNCLFFLFFLVGWVGWRLKWNEWVWWWCGVGGVGDVGEEVGGMSEALLPTCALIAPVWSMFYFYSWMCHGFL